MLLLVSTMFKLRLNAHRNILPQTIGHGVNKPPTLRNRHRGLEHGSLKRAMYAKKLARGADKTSGRSPFHPRLLRKRPK